MVNKTLDIDRGKNKSPITRETYDDAKQWLKKHKNKKQLIDLVIVSQLVMRNFVRHKGACGTKCETCGDVIKMYNEVW